MTLDGFLQEIRAAAGEDFPEMQRLEAAFHRLQTSDDPQMIAEHDIIRALLHPALPLLERVQAVVARMEERQQ